MIDFEPVSKLYNKIQEELNKNEKIPEDTRIKAKLILTLIEDCRYLKPDIRRRDVKRY